MSRIKLAAPIYRLKLRGGVHYICWTDPATGRSRSVSTRQSEHRAAEIWRDQWIAGREQPLPPAEPRIAAIVDAYVASRTPHIEGVDTMARCAVILRRHVGNLEPRMLGRRTFLDRRQKEGVENGTIRRETGVLRAALAWAVREQWIGAAPYVEMPSMPPPRDRWLTHDEIERLIKCCATPHVRLFVVLAYHTAARRGAILDLTWDRVDLARRVVHYAMPGRRQTKKRRATVPINEDALIELAAAREVAVSSHVIEFRGAPVKGVRTAFDQACARANIEDCSPHVIRHTSATHMVMAGVPIQEIARMLGDTVAMVEQVYGKHSPDYLRRAAGSLSRRNRIVSPT